MLFYLNRTSPLTLTYAGHALQTRAKQLLDLKDETYKEIADIKDFSTGSAFHWRFSHQRPFYPSGDPSYLSERISRNRTASDRRQFQRAGK